MNILKTDWLHKGLKFISHNRGLCVWIILISISLSFAGCAVKTASLKDSTVLVKQPVFEREVADIGAKLEAEWASYVRAVEIGRDDIAQQYELRSKILGIVMSGAELGQSAAISAGVPKPITDIAMNLFGTLGLAGSGLLLYDNRRKNKLIPKKKKV